MISSHTLYKIKIKDDSLLCLKNQVALHGIEYSFRHPHKSECAMCSPTVIRFVLRNAKPRCWPLSKADYKAAFLHNGRADRDVYVLPRRESNNKQHFWLLLSAAYGLVNTNEKFQAIR